MFERKRLLQLIPGIGANVIDGNLNDAIRLWKSELKKSGKLTDIYNKQFHVSKSDKIKGIKNKAKFRQQKQTEELNQK